MWPRLCWFGTSSSPRSRQRASSGAHLVVRDRARLAPDLLVPAVGERVLGVELQLVELQTREEVDLRRERPHRRHLRAADVEQDAAAREVGPVLDRTAGIAARSSWRRTDLIQGRPGVALARCVPGGDLDPLTGPRSGGSPARGEPRARRVRARGARRGSRCPGAARVRRGGGQRSSNRSPLSDPCPLRPPRSA